MTNQDQNNPLSLEKLAQISVPANLMAELDMGNVLKELKMLFSKTEAVGAKVAEVGNAGLFMKIVNGISGKTTKTFTEAVQIQNELAKAQTALLIINLFFAKELHKQQEELGRQSAELIEQNQKLDKQHEELKKLTEKSLDQQKTILELHKLTEGQEKAIRDLMKKANRLVEIEEQHTVKLEEYQKFSNTEILSLKQKTEELEKKLKVISDTTIFTSKRLQRTILGFIIIVTVFSGAALFFLIRLLK